MVLEAKAVSLDLETQRVSLGRSRLSTLKAQSGDCAGGGLVDLWERSSPPWALSQVLATPIAAAETRPEREDGLPLPALARRRCGRARWSCTPSAPPTSTCGRASMRIPRGGRAPCSGLASSWLGFAGATQPAWHRT